jgi:glycosyltransferase involved in cell wall biosynthesis
VPAGLASAEDREMIAPDARSARTTLGPEGTPLVTVVFPCRNAVPYVGAALESILSQTYRHLEVLVVDNASSDATVEIVTRMQERDPRIVLLRNPRDIGIAGSLNRGLRAARGEFIARMDADDIAEPNRLERQLAFMRSHPECIICGSHITLIDEEDRVIGSRRFPTSDREIKRIMLLEIPFCHPATFLRAAPISEHGILYDEAIETVEDRDFWLRLARYGAYANVDEYLLRYRVSRGAMKHREARRTLVNIVRLQVRHIADPEHRSLRLLAMVLAQSLLLPLPKSAISFLYRLKYRTTSNGAPPPPRRAHAEAVPREVS